MEGWVSIFHNGDKTVIGLCGFAGPPGADGTVELAYGIAPGYQNRGHAKETAQELVAFALASGRVRTVCAHTLPEKRLDAGANKVRLYPHWRGNPYRHDGLMLSRWEMQPV